MDGWMRDYSFGMPQSELSPPTASCWAFWTVVSFQYLFCVSVPLTALSAQFLTYTIEEVVEVAYEVLGRRNCHPHWLHGALASTTISALHIEPSPAPPNPSPQVSHFFQGKH